MTPPTDPPRPSPAAEQADTCVKCAHYHRCQWLISRKPTDAPCDWTPSRFVPLSAQSASPPAPPSCVATATMCGCVRCVPPQEAPANTKTLNNGSVNESVFIQSPSSSEASFAERAREVCSKFAQDYGRDGDFGGACVRLQDAIAALAQSVRDEVEAKYGPLVVFLGKGVDAQYIDSGTFQGGEEDCYHAGIERGSDVLVFGAESLRSLRAAVSPSGREGAK